MNYQAIRELLFLLPPEAAHSFSLQAIALSGALNLSPLLTDKAPEDPIELMGLRFPNRVGLAAGLDKDARCIDGLASLGFGHIEVGTVTPRAQPGNPLPRLFRLPQHKALINRLGFNNAGAAAMASRIRQARYKGVLGVNIGKNRDTPLQQALDDYRACMAEVYGLASYLVVNISSPNTPGLRALQEETELPRFLDGLKQAHRREAEGHGKDVPLLVKIAPDLTDEELGFITAELIRFELAGVIVSNTTTDRPQITGPHAAEEGGLSGAPLLDKANQALAVVAAEAKGKLAIIGVGGITRPEDAAQKITLGADLVQLYTGFIYEGPALVQNSIHAIKTTLEH
ncbi:MAG: quinone-dependent dihydroorotate dehydrogenase [Pseudomonadales bacterium]